MFLSGSFHRELAFFLPCSDFYCVSILHLVLFGGPRIDLDTRSNVWRELCLVVLWWRWRGGKGVSGVGWPWRCSSELGWGEGEHQERCSGVLRNLKAQISPEKNQTLWGSLQKGIQKVCKFEGSGEPPGTPLSLHVQTCLGIME